MRLSVALVVSLLLACGESSAGSRTLKKVVLTATNQVFITAAAKSKFDRKQVSCRYKGGGKFEAGFITTTRRVKSWNNISEFIKKQKRAGKDVRQLKRQASKAAKSCVNIQNSCVPTLRVDPIQATENTPILVDTHIDAKCGLPTQLVRIQDPARGTVESSPQGFIYTPLKHALGNDSLRIAVANMFKQSATVEAPITISQLRAEFAGDKNSLEPYRKQLTRNEVMSVLKRVGLGGDASLWSIRDADQLADALLDETETAAATTRFQAYNRARLDRAQSASASYNPRFFYGDIQALNATFLRYGRAGRTWMSHIFWANHFATDVTAFSNTDIHQYAWDHFQTLLDHSIGNFRTLMYRLFHDYPFQSYLNNTTNTYAEPSQNFPREFLELFTAGAKDPITQENNYREDEVISSTRFLSGWNFNGATTSYRGNPTTTPTTPIGVEASDGDPYFYSGSPDCSTQTPNKISISWEPNPNAASVQIHRAPRGSSTYTLLGQVSASAAIYQDANGCVIPGRSSALDPLPNTIYDYKLRPVALNGTLGPFSAIDSGYFGTVPSTPSSPAFTVSLGTYSDKVVISWSSVAGATGYRVYKIQADGSRRDRPLTGILPNSQLSFEDFNVVPGQPYLYYVRAIAANGAHNVRSGHGSDEIEAIKGFSYAEEADLGMVEHVTPTVGTRSDGIALSWDAVPHAAGYRIFRATGWFTIPTYIVDIPANLTSYLDQTASTASYHHYFIAAIDANGAIGPLQKGARFNPINWAQNADTLDPRTFLAWLPDNHPNAAGKIMGAIVNGQPQGEAMSAFGEGFPNEPVGSFVDHVITQWPATRRNIGAKLFAQIVHRQITESLVSEVGQDLYANQFNLKPVLRKLLTSSAMFSPEANGTGVANPMEVIYSMLRLSELPLTGTRTLNAAMFWIYAAGNDIGAPPNVFGFPDCGLVRGGQVQDGSAWIQSPQTYITLGNAVSAILYEQGIASGSGGEGINLINYFSPTSITTPGALVDHIAAIFQVPLSADQRNILIAYLNKDDNGNASPWNRSQSSRLLGLIRLVVMSVEFLKK